MNIRREQESGHGGADEDRRPLLHQRLSWHEMVTTSWFVVRPEELSSVESVPVFGICFSGRPPRAVERRDLEPPAAHPLRRTGGVILVHTLINAKGKVVKAQILRGPADLQDAVVRCLRQWRFEPALAHGRKPAAVHFTVALPVEPGGP